MKHFRVYYHYTEAERREMTAAEITLFLVFFGILCYVIGAFCHSWW